jgi:cobalt-zinc-cadmium efflux system outer membrane protein
LNTRPDLAAAREQVSQSRSLKGLATASVLPVPVVSVVYQHTPFASGLRYAFGITVPVPLFYWNGGERERANAGLSTAEVAVQRARVQIEADVAVAIGNFRSAQVLADRYQSGLLEQSAAALETSRFAYEHGAASLLELLDAIRTYGETRSEYYSTVHDYWVAAYALSRAVGAGIVRE